MGLFRKTGVVGLEIDTGVIRAVELKGSPGKVTVTSAGRKEIPEAAVVDGVVVEVDTVARALEELWSEAQIGSRQVVLGVSNQGVLMRLASFPKVPESKLAQALRFQAGDYFPIPMNQLIMDHAVVGELKGESGPALEILLVAARRDQLDKSLEALKQARLLPIVVDASPLASLRTLGEEILSGTVALANISNGLGTLLLVSAGIPRFARIIPVSLQLYSRELGVPLSQMDRAFRRWHASSGDYSALGEWGLLVASEIGSSITYFLNQNNGDSVDRVLLSGRGARVGGLSSLMEDELGVPVKVIEPLAKVAVRPSRGVDLESEGLDFTVSIGLGLRGLEA